MGRTLNTCAYTFFLLPKSLKHNVCGSGLGISSGGFSVDGFGIDVVECGLSVDCSHRDLGLWPLTIFVEELSLFKFQRTNHTFFILLGLHLSKKPNKQYNFRFLFPYLSSYTKLEPFLWGFA